MQRSTAGLALALLVMAGCQAGRSDQRTRDPAVTPSAFNVNEQAPGGPAGSRVEPRYCQIASAILMRPSGDPVVESSPWNLADVQAIDPAVRQTLDANGIRVGIITGELPPDLLAAFKPAPPIKETSWVQIAVPEGERTPIVLGARVEAVSLFLNHKGKLDGRDYRAATGRVTITARHHGSNQVGLRIVPEIHHGDERRNIGALQNAGPFSPREFGIQDGQQEDILRDIAASVELSPGQTLLVGCKADQARSLGAFLFTQPEPNSDRVLQSLLLIQANRNRPGSAPAVADGQPAELPALDVTPLPAKDVK